MALELKTELAILTVDLRSARLQAETMASNPEVSVALRGVLAEIETNLGSVIDLLADACDAEGNT